MDEPSAKLSFFSGGLPADQVREELARARAGDAQWNHPRNLRASYFAGDEAVRIATEAFTAYLGQNALYGAMAYPSLRRLEAEVVAILLRLFRAPPGAAGSITTGGTESIFMAVKTARDWARDHRPAARVPTLVIPRTAHAAFDKAAALLGLRVRRMRESPGFVADVEGMARAIDDDTIMIVGSAPPYAYGVVDPLPEIAALAGLHGLWFHVDACVGGMVLPFARDQGFSIPSFDFELSAVTSISVDLHKYGYAFHGCSALLLRSSALEVYQRYHFEDWPVGTYTTTNFAGSRSGGPVASAWAIMKLLGYDGFRERVARLLATKARLIDGIRRIEGLEVFGAPEGPNFSFGGKDLDIVAIAQELSRRGWTFARQVEPPGLILLVNGFHDPVVEPFLTDLREVADGVRGGAIRAQPVAAVYTV